MRTIDDQASLELFVVVATLLTGSTNLGWLSTVLDRALIVPAGCEALGLGLLFSGLLMMSGCSRGPGALCAAIAFSGGALLSAASGVFLTAATCLGLSVACALVAARRAGGAVLSQRPATGTRSC